MSVIALDIAILPPPAIGQLAMDLSAALPASESKGLLLDSDHVPHITLTQQFVRESDLDAYLESVAEVLRDRAPLRLDATGGAGSGTVWIGIERTPAIRSLHEQLLEATARFEQRDGDVSAFFGGDARNRDVHWVSNYRAKSSYEHFLPHITLGHTTHPPLVQPFSFEASMIAVCHLGRFCTCRRIVRAWELARRQHISGS